VIGFAVEELAGLMLEELEAGKDWLKLGLLAVVALELSVRWK